jgi:pimeloyl-ACP methyl ester carboxylesterase
MSRQHDDEQHIRARTFGDHRERLLAGIPVAEHRMRLAGISTSVLIGGAGPPVVLLHGPGEFGAKWIRVLPSLLTTHRVIAPDLPCHGNSDAIERPEIGRVLDWLGELIDRTCPSPPALVGHVLGGAIGARFAIDRGGRLGRLVLVDTLGLAPFRPSPGFAITMLGFLMRPTERTYDRFMRQCSFDLDSLRVQLGERWEPYAAYSVDQARAPRAKAISRFLRKVGLPRIPPEDLARITVPTTLIWGRHDRANRLRIAETASARYGWPLLVIDDCADDPPRDRPEAFLQALSPALETLARKEVVA